MKTLYTLFALLGLGGLSIAGFTVMKTDDVITTTPLAMPDSAVLWQDGTQYKIRLKNGVDISLGNAGGSLAADFANLQPVTWAVDQHNVALPTGSGWRINLAANRDLTGVAGGTDGKVLLVFPGGAGSGNLKIKKLNTSSAVGNRFVTPDLADYDLKEKGSVYIRYDSTLDGGNGAWHVLDNKP